MSNQVGCIYGCSFCGSHPGGTGTVWLPAFPKSESCILTFAGPGSALRRIRRRSDIILFIFAGPLKFVFSSAHEAHQVVDSMRQIQAAVEKRRG